MESNYPIVYAVKHKDLHTRMQSRSGGIFTAISDVIISNNGVVYGCAMTEELKVIHTRATTVEERNNMRGSKYVQSNLGDIFQLVKSDLENKVCTLFSGTSCQIAGLKSYLTKEYENLLCVDILCHGVPSPKVLSDYIEWQESTHSSKCTKMDFRNKEKFGWGPHIETLYMNKENEKNSIDSNVFATLFINHNILRPACYKCPYKSVNHEADITIADYWGIERAAPEFNDDKGVSLVLLNTNKGQEYFINCIEHIEYQECDIHNSIQQTMVRPFDKPKKRAKFWDDYQKLNFGEIVKRYGTMNLCTKIKRKLFRIMMRIIKS